MALTTKLPRSISEFFCLPPSDYVLSKTLAASVAESFGTPDGAEFVAFSSNSDFYANYTTTATVPADVTDGTASELNPTIRRLRFQDGTVIGAISVISAGAAQITASYYKAA